MGDTGSLEITKFQIKFRETEKVTPSYYVWELLFEILDAQRKVFVWKVISIETNVKLFIFPTITKIARKVHSTSELEDKYSPQCRETLKIPSVVWMRAVKFGSSQSH